MGQFASKTVFFLSLVIVSTLLIAPAAFAQDVVLSVDNTTDAEDASPGDGACATAEGDCTFRAAVQEANTQASPLTVILPAGVYTLASDGGSEGLGDLDITGNVRVIGAGRDLSFIDGGGMDRVFDVTEGATLDLSGVTIRNGAAQQGGGILNAGTLVLTDSAVTDNASLSGGGGIYNQPGAKAILANVDVTGNIAERGEKGGGIFNAGFLRLQTGSVSGNTAVTGGGLHNEGVLLAVGTLINGNDAVGGGGVDNDGAATLVQVTISGNEASFAGGVLSGGRLLLIESDVNSNSPDNCSGGIWVTGFAGDTQGCPSASNGPASD